MSGVQLSLLQKTTIDMGALAVAGNGPEVFYALNVNMVAYREAMLLIRIHSRTMPANSEVQFMAYNSAPSMDDPATVFRNTTNLISGFKVAAATAVPLLTTSAVPSAGGAFGGTLDFSYRPLFVAGGGTFIVTMSIDLVLKY